MKEPKELGFDFQEIPLTDGEVIARAGNGNYADIILMLSQKLPEIEERNSEVEKKEQKSLAFALPGNKEIDPKLAKPLCHSVNLALKKGGILWVVCYSEKKKLFVCIPKIINGSKPRSYATRGTLESSLKKAEQIQAYKAQGLTALKIAELTKMSLSAVNYYFYTKSGIGKNRAKASSPRNQNKNPDTLEFRNNVVALAKRGMLPIHIAKELDAKMGRVNAVYYKYFKGANS